MKAISAIAILLIICVTVSGDPIERREADSLFAVLAKTKPGIGRIDILNRLAQFYIFKPGENPIDFDSAAKCLSEARQLNVFVKSPSAAGLFLVTESYMLREEGHKDSAIMKLESAIKILESVDDKFNLAKTIYELSGYYDYNNIDEFKIKLGLVERSVTAFRQTGNSREKGDALMMLGDLCHSNGENDKATEVLNEALAVYNSINQKALQGVYILLGRICFDRNDNKQAFSYELLALKAAESCQDTTMQLCQINSELAGQYTFGGRYDLALRHFKEALKTALKYDDRHAITMIVWSISRTYTYLNRTGESLDLLASLPSNLLHPSDAMGRAFINMSYLNAYIETRQFKKARQYCDTLVSLVDTKSVSVNLENVINRMAASYYLETKQFSKAKLYLSRNEPITKLMRGARAGASDERLWYKVDSAQGNYKAAFDHLLEYKRISDFLFDETKSVQFQQSEVEYETAKKNDSLKSKDQLIGLLTQRNKLQQTNLKQADFIRNISIAGTALILIVTLLLYQQFRSNQRSNKIIVQKNEELQDMLTEKEWWLKEVHHRVKNNLHTIICLLESQAMYLKKDALQAIEKTQHRIYAMSLIHQKLYQNEDLKVIDVSIYLEEFISYLKDSFEADNIDFIIRVEPVHLNLQQAIPVALIINEGVTNAIKYAFAHEMDAKIWVSLSESDGMVKLSIMDNGKGFELSEEDERKSLGIQLIKGLSKELKGTVLIDAKGGTRLSVAFTKGPLTDKFPVLQNNNLG